MAGTTGDNLHIYAGYAGWTPKQLEAEVEIGAWFIFPADTGTVFATNPESVWQHLISRTEERVAAVRPLVWYSIH